jgi:hypothetical protein
MTGHAGTGERSSGEFKVMTRSGLNLSLEVVGSSSADMATTPPIECPTTVMSGGLLVLSLAEAAAAYLGL